MSKPVADLPETALAVLEIIAERRAIQAESAAVPARPAVPARRDWTIEDRAIAYLDRCDPAISGQRGHDRTFAVACKIGPGFDLPPEVALRLLATHYNPRCDPPWSDAELRHKAEDAYAVEARRGWLRDEPLHRGDSNGRPPPPGANGSGNGHASRNGLFDYAALSEAQLGLTLARDVNPAAVKWLWEYHLARGEMAIIAGEGGLGKSMFLLAVASAVSTGGPWPGDRGNAPVGHVVIVSAEDDAETTLRPRLEALGASLGNVTFCKARVTMERDGERLVHPMSLQDHSYWKAVFKHREDTALFIVDPIPSYLGRGVNDRQNSEIREVLEPFIEDVIRPRGICFYCNTHLNKTVDARTPVQRITGSIAYANIPRNVHLIVRDPDNPARRYFKQCKSNNAPDNLAALAFTIARHVVTFAGEDIETAVPVFEDDPVENLDLSELMNAGQGGRGRPPGAKSGRLAEWLWNQLKDGQPRRIVQLVDAARDAGLMAPAVEGKLKPSVAPLYRSMERIPDLHPGWSVQDGPTETLVSGKELKTWKLVQENEEEEDDDGPPY